MRKSIIRELLLYRYRYVAGLALYTITLAALLLLRTDLAPTGLADVEMTSAVASSGLTAAKVFDQSLINFPYHLLQKASLHYFGVNDTGIIIPSIIFGLLTGIAFIVMVYRWFHLNVALITGFILISSAAFLSAGRTGYPAIMPTFWLSLILLAATNVIHPEGKTKTWMVIGLILAPLSLYTPLMIYPLIAIGVAGLLHPHVRYAFRHVSLWQYGVAALLVIILLSPLLISFLRHPQDALTLLGIPSHPLTMQELGANAKMIGKSLLSLGKSSVGLVPQPIFGAASLILIILGVIKSAQEWYSARAYMLFICTIIFAPLLLFNPDQLLICLVPAYLFMAIGIETIIREWYKLFPSNPYARLAGLLPLIVLLGGIMLSNLAQFFYGHFYGVTTTDYSLQFSAVKQALGDKEFANKPVTIVTTPDHATFYNLLHREHPLLTITTAPPTTPVNPTIVMDGTPSAAKIQKLPQRILTSYRAQEDKAVLARIYLP